ncbi:MAG: hypothetical protein ACP5RQ_02775 [Candidatus Micrarchaeia archaeon]
MSTDIKKIKIINGNGNEKTNNNIINHENYINNLIENFSKKINQDKDMQNILDALYPNLLNLDLSNGQRVITSSINFETDSNGLIHFSNNYEISINGILSTLFGTEIFVNDIFKKLDEIYPKILEKSKYIHIGFPNKNIMDMYEERDKFRENFINKGAPALLSEFKNDAEEIKNSYLVLLSRFEKSLEKLLDSIYNDVSYLAQLKKERENFNILKNFLSPFSRIDDDYINCSNNIISEYEKEKIKIFNQILDRRNELYTFFNEFFSDYQKYVEIRELLERYTQLEQKSLKNILRAANNYDYGLPLPIVQLTLKWQEYYKSNYTNYKPKSYNPKINFVVPKSTNSKGKQQGQTARAHHPS